MVAMLFACAATLLGFAAARALSARLGHPPWASPVLVTALGVELVLWGLGAPVARYMAAVMPLRWLLGPALVALALVIEGNRALLMAEPGPFAIAIAGGAMVGVGSAIGLARLAGLDQILVQALATKSVTAPFAVAVMKSVGGPVGLAAALSVTTGVIGALTIPPLFDRLRITGAGRSLGIGVASHIVGTDWLTRRDPKAGGLAALALVLAGLAAAVVLPSIWGRL
jgi:putative effector of murein hydrolase